MSQPFVAEIRMFGGNFPPKGWALCNGQTLPISQNTALFALLGTYYGGNGQSTFALPDLQASAPMHQGQGPGTSQRYLGEIGGQPAVTLLVSEMPFHTHIPQATDASTPPQISPENTDWSSIPGRTPPPVYSTSTTPNAVMAPTAIAPAGGSIPHNNMQPYLAVTFIIAMQGVFPQRP